MKKFFFILTAFVCAMSLQARTIYLNAGGSALWDQGGAVFFVHSWEGTNTNEKDLKMSLVGVGVYGVEAPDENSKIIFVRMPNGSTALNWATMWNQTNDLVIPEDRNCYQITGWGEGEGAKSTGVWTTYEPEPLSFYIAGEGLPGVTWDNHLLMENNTISFTDLPAGTYKFKVTTGNWAGIIMGIGSVNPVCSTTNGYSGDQDGNITVQLAGTGSITVSIVDELICLTIEGETEEFVGGNGVPSECRDVLLQAFYYDSYEVDSTHMGTEQFGDTKWKTLQKQVGEIGAYFDLVWLPPSALASGVGYHPRQYCNQNSAWGTRADLDKLIASLHNSNTKVVADIVINHSEAMGGWCDMAEEDFGVFGKFQPDETFITSNDEVNWPENNVDTLAGDCFEYSKNSRADDGQNWDAARDWAHDNPAVQEMFKAYLKWMKAEMKYDGWRYDKGDGYNNWHMDNYNHASEPYIAFEEYYDGNVETLKTSVRNANMHMMALDFALKFNGINPIQGWDYVGRRGLIGEDETGSDYWKRHSVTWVDNHDMFMREDNELEFCGRGNSMKPEIKARLLGANAFILSMPGVPCIFYPHWYVYKEELKEMINARHLAGVHSESEVSYEYYDMVGDRHAGYQATVRGKNGWLILCLGTKAKGEGFAGYKLMSSHYGTFNDNGKAINESYEIWVNATGEEDPAPGLIVTPSQAFEDSINGIDVTIQAVGGNGTPVIYYTTDGSNPTTESAVYTGPLNFKETTTLKVMAVCGNATSKVQTYTYTYREPLQRGIQVRFNKPASWEKVYFYAWRPYKDEEGNDASENIIGAYPGRRIFQDMEGWYTYEFAADMDSVNFCINSGDDCGGINVRSNDLVTDYDACYGWIAGKDTESNQEMLEDCEKQLHPEFDISVGPEPQYFTDNDTIDVVINAVGEESAMIYYTTDGSEPTTSSSFGVSPITFQVTKTTTVKAYAQKDKTRTATKTATYTYKAPQSGPLEVRFLKPDNWEDLYLYAFTRVKVDGKYKDTPYSLDGKNAKWPGMKWTTMEGKWYKHVMKPELKEIYIIFNIGSNKTQTQDIYLTENTCYLWNEGCYKAVVDRDCDGEPDEPFIEGIEMVESKVKNNNETYKLIINGHLVIVHNGAMYDVLGRKL